jgi:hypothetical protein
MKRSNNTNGALNATWSLKLLSSLVLAKDTDLFDSPNGSTSLHSQKEIEQIVAGCGPQDFGEIWSLANSHHVLMRTLPALHRLMLESGNSKAEWAERAMVKERARIQHALSHLAPICEALGKAGDVIVIKSLDHWPDLGSDLDLYTNAQPDAILAIMRDQLKATADARSWGDRLANKWNFIVPGLPELVEVHVRRLGQTGEQVAVTDSLVARSTVTQFDSFSLRVPAPEDRLIISTLQRMYRHFYLRLCDIADTARLVDSNAIDYVYLKSLAQSAGLWDGLATYLFIVSDYAKSYRGAELALPPLVTGAAHFGNERLSFRRRFLRIPIFPQAARFYISELERLLLNGELRNTFRLTLLPGLAAAAALEMKLTGSDKGIW